jgi:DNA polymerase-3 subunit gamma/tau
VDVRSAELTRLLLSGGPSAGSLAEALKLVAAVRDDGVDMRRFSREVVDYLRELLLVKADAADSLDQPRETLAEMQTLTREVDGAEIVRALKALGRLDFRDDPQSSLPLELALVELAPEGERPATPEPAPAPEPAAVEEPEPQFSIPVSGTEEVAATTAGATVSATEETEEAPPPAGVPPDPSSASGGSGQALLTQIREACKESDKQLAALLNASCEVKSLEGDVLTLGFYHTFHLERVEAGRYLDRLNELFSQALGRPVTTELVHSPRRPTPGKIKGGHLARAARELGAKPVVRQGEGPALSEAEGPIGKGEESWPSGE